MDGARMKCTTEGTKIAHFNRSEMGKGKGEVGGIAERGK